MVRWRSVEAKDEGGRNSLPSAVLISAQLPAIGCPNGFVLGQHIDHL